MRFFWRRPKRTILWKKDIIRWLDLMLESLDNFCKSFTDTCSIIKDWLASDDRSPETLEQIAVSLENLLNIAKTFRGKVSNTSERLKREMEDAGHKK